jgi:streptogramin lyase
VAELDPAGGTLIRTIAAGADADFLGFSPGSVWVSNYGEEFLWRIDPASGAVASKLDIGAAGAQGGAFDGSALSGCTAPARPCASNPRPAMCSAVS